MSASLNKVRHSFAWLRQSRYWLLVIMLAGWAASLGVLAYQRPVTYQLNVGGNDAPFVGNVDPRRATRAEENRSMRWVRGGGSIYLPAISPSYPITLSLYTGGGGRRDVSSGRPVTLTLQINDHPLPPIRLTENNQWYRWRLEPRVFKDGRLNLSFSIPNQITGIVFWPEGVIVEWLKVEPAVSPETIADFTDLDWRQVAYLVAIVLLAYSFFPLAGRRVQLFGILFCILLAVGLAMLLQGNRPFFAFYAPTIALALLLIRLLAPLINRDSSERHTLRWLFLLTLGFGLLMAMPEFQSGDDGMKYLVAEDILTHNTLQLPPVQKDMGSSYSRYALGHTIAELPLLGVGVLVQQVNGAPATIRYVFVMLLDPIVSAFGVALLFLSARRLFKSERLAVALSLIYYFATFALPYAVQSWSEPLVATLLLLAFYAMLRVFDSAEDKPVRWLLIAGIALGYALFTKEEFALVAAIFGLWWLVRRAVALRQVGAGWVGLTTQLLCEGIFLAVPMFCFYGFSMAYNYIRSGSLFTSSYVAQGILSFDTPLLTGLYGLLLSPGKGLVWVAPSALLALWGVVRFGREHRWEMALIAVLFVPALLFYATYIFWDGGVSWGPRFLLPFLPLLMLVSGAALQGWGGWQRWQRGIYGGLVAIGAVVAVVGMLVNPSDAWLFGRDQVGDPWDQQVEFSVQHSLILNAFRLVGRGYIQPQSAAQLSHYHFPYFTDQLLPALLLTLVVVAALRLESGLHNRLAEADEGRVVLPSICYNYCTHIIERNPIR